MIDAAAAPHAPEKGHPPALYILFFTEMWERFSFYGMKAMLLLYIMDQFKFGHERANDIYSWYIALVYLPTPLGGLIADKVLGYRKTIIVGGVLMMFGHFFMAIERYPVFLAALALLIVGSGCFKANISTVVGMLYPQGDHRRDRAFSIFYLGINIGAFVSPIACGWLHDHYGYKWGFAAAGFGMLIGLIIFLVGQPFLRGVNLDLPAKREELPAAERDKAVDPPEVIRGRVIALFIVCFFVLFFWMAYEQSGNTLTLWARDNTNRFVTLPLIGTFQMSVESFQAINPILILLLTPPLTYLWKVLDGRKREPSSPAKQATGLAFVGVSFIVMVFAARVAGGDRGVVSSWWLFWSYFFATVGELCLSPIGLSLFSKLAPPRWGGAVMGIWFVSIFAGNKLSGVTGAYWDRMSHLSFFWIFVISSFGAAALMFLILRPLRKLMAGAD
jgi:proton-dependent oligopeptide transporter, POT family